MPRPVARTMNRAVSRRCGFKKWRHRMTVADALQGHSPYATVQSRAARMNRTGPNRPGAAGG